MGSSQLQKFCPTPSHLWQLISLKTFQSDLPLPHQKHGNLCSSREWHVAFTSQDSTQMTWVRFLTSFTCTLCGLVVGRLAGGWFWPSSRSLTDAIFGSIKNLAFQPNWTVHNLRLKSDVLLELLNDQQSMTSKCPTRASVAMLFGDPPQLNQKQVFLSMNLTCPSANGRWSRRQ